MFVYGFQFLNSVRRARTSRTACTGCTRTATAAVRDRGQRRQRLERRAGRIDARDRAVDPRVVPLLRDLLDDERLELLRVGPADVDRRLVGRVRRHRSTAPSRGSSATIAPPFALNLSSWRRARSRRGARARPPAAGRRRASAGRCRRTAAAGAARSARAAGRASRRGAGPSRPCRAASGRRPPRPRSCRSSPPRMSQPFDFSSASARSGEISPT